MSGDSEHLFVVFQLYIYQTSLLSNYSSKHEKNSRPSGKPDGCCGFKTCSGRVIQFTFFLFHKGLCGMWHGSQTQNSCKKKKQKNPRGMWVGERDYLRIQKESKIIHVSESRRPSRKKRATFQLQRKKVTTIKKKCFQTAQSQTFHWLSLKQKGALDTEIKWGNRKNSKPSEEICLMR